METVKVLDRQSIFDIAVQHIGSAEAEFELALLNGLSLSDEVATGAELILPAPDVAIKTVREYFLNRQLKPATGTTSESIPGGINYMGIEINFIVS
ncbi:MAG: hypothetical protein LBN27_10665 [Prevotellaceae bacterium]|jgi:hypothetical protein|nr:hypothetical protein [Prevotellaceae bacterium]